MSGTPVPIPEWFDPYGSSDPATKALAYKQHLQAKGTQPSIECGCGRAMPLRFFFRCLYCGCWFCEPCAEVHFGMTRAQYREQQT